MAVPGSSPVQWGTMLGLSYWLAPGGEMIAFFAGTLSGLVFGIPGISLCVTARRGDEGMGWEG